VSKLYRHHRPKHPYRIRRPLKPRQCPTWPPIFYSANLARNVATDGAVEAGMGQGNQMRYSADITALQYAINHKRHGCVRAEHATGIDSPQHMSPANQIRARKLSAQNTPQEKTTNTLVLGLAVPCPGEKSGFEHFTTFHKKLAYHSEDE